MFVKLLVSLAMMPLQPRSILIPVADEAFTRVMIDCVGRLPKTKSECEYILTIMCSTSRFPEATPLRNIKARTVSNVLVNFFTLFGLPKEVQSDQGSNFMSGMSLVLDKLSLLHTTQKVKLLQKGFMQA